MNSSTFSFLARAALAAAALSFLSGCAVITVAGAAVGAAGTAAGLVVDGAVGAVKLTGKAVGAAADVVLPSSDDKQK